MGASIFRLLPAHRAQIHALNHLNRIEGVLSFQTSHRLSRSDLGFRRKSRNTSSPGAIFRFSPVQNHAIPGNYLFSRPTAISLSNFFWFGSLVTPLWVKTCLNLTADHRPAAIFLRGSYKSRVSHDLLYHAITKLQTPDQLCSCPSITL